MVGFTPSQDVPLPSAPSFTRFVAGAESNVAIGLRKLGHASGWMSRVGNDPFGETILAQLSALQVDVSRVGLSDRYPTGVLFKDRSVGVERKVVYYRKGSAMSHVTPEHIDADYIASAKVFHVSGITLALSEDSRRTAVRSMEIAKEHGVQVFFDPNYRHQLWSESEARRVFRHITPFIDVLMPGVEEAHLFFDDRSSMPARPEDVVTALAEKGFREIYLKQGDEGASFWVDGHRDHVAAVSIDVIDTVGAGDAFAAGVIGGRLEGLSPRDTTRLANVMGALATTAVGDTEGVSGRHQVQRLYRAAYGGQINEPADGET